ncbi:cyclin-dependent kinase inhibitor 1-like [Hoplias malabaricus]|uniref:cyclin-dependent kinase inhibitor 1-like n=1 Tax=Hoplias malabaricus TaxID=27720 RepID=UPI00346232C7
MANVDVQSVLERHAARRTFPLLARTKVCRNLFGPMDHDELQREMTQKLREISEAERTRWNFNFEQDSPLPGNYAWEEVCARSVPAFYRDSRAPEREEVNEGNGAEREPESKTAEHERESDRKNAGEARVELNQENQSGALNGTPACTRKQKRRRTVPEYNSTHITDFFPRRKRPAEVKQPENALSVEITPRKRIR